MPTFKTAIDIMPHKELLDPQGKTVAKSMSNLNISGVHDVRIGKHIEIIVEASDAEEANREIEDACKRLLANVIMEKHEYTISGLIDSPNT